MSRAVVAIVVSFAIAIGAITHGGFLVSILDTTASVLADSRDPEPPLDPTPPSVDDPELPLPPSPSPTIYEYEDEDLGTVQSYAVNEQGVLEPQPPAGSREEYVWNMFLRMTSAAYAGKVIGDYTVGDNPDADTLAWVSKYDDSPYWTFAVNLDSSDELDVLIPTLVHEYGHLLSLGRTQMEVEFDSCGTLDLTEGCPTADAALWKFQQQFWSGLEGAPSIDNDDWDITDEFYARYEDQFVSNYAATNVVEDFAETFMVYVIEDVPTGDSVAAEKMRFMATIEGYPAIRDRIRNEFAGDLGIVP